jgi:hypothetical protein
MTLTSQQFLAAINRTRMVDFPIERDPADAWPDFVGWRLNYERFAYTVAQEVCAVPTLWSEPRRHATAAVPLLRPPEASQPKHRVF